MRVNFGFLLRREFGWDGRFESLLFGELECFEIFEDRDQFKTGAIR